MRYIAIMLVLFGCLFTVANDDQALVYYASFDEGQSNCIYDGLVALGSEGQQVVKVKAMNVVFSQEQIGRVDLVVKAGDQVQEFFSVASGKQELNFDLAKAAKLEVSSQAYAFSGIENAMVSVVFDVEFAASAADVRAPKKPYGNLQLQVHKVKNGKNISFVGAMNINRAGSFNAATYTAKTAGNVSIKVAAINKNGGGKEIALFNKKTKKGETYFLNHKPIRSNGIFVVSTVVRNVNGAAKFNAGAVTYAVIKKATAPGQKPNNAPKKPYGNLRLRVSPYNQGKGASFVGLSEILHRGNFNSATFTAQTTGKVVIKVAAINANGNTKEISLFNKSVKKGETYLVNHKPIRSTGMFVVTTTVTGPKSAKGFNAGGLSYAVTKK
ncbi:hypothetical protein [Candidatus Uabimicrobium amorphum]|uniref:Uncharacterized protein n=1 Tax=Uabimicrobium amorphum TaxID=2596890 RepID=A0A5S9INL4_UABAM|nr:hypothetical protein [Candidatus Uabimicrobium amorphum]BBM84736.1 hypothetical protein UABAM_03097 [Candidatus Uabimicrobium amorphum]